MSGERDSGAVYVLKPEVEGRDAAVAPARGRVAFVLRPEAF